MALRLAESLLGRSGLNVSDVGTRYLGWWQEGAFDTGPTVARVLSLVAAGVSFEEAAARADREAGGMTAGCNPAHRSAPLAMCASIDDSALVAAAVEEARLTHQHQLAGGVAAAVARLCRALIRGAPWPVALGLAADGRSPETRRVLEALRPSELSPDGYAPMALGAAIHFVGTSASFPTALERAVDFAGPANYCPVLVGSIGGARWGRAQVEEACVAHQGDLVPRVETVACALAAGWTGAGA